MKTVKCDKRKNIIFTDVSETFGQDYYSFTLKVEDKENDWDKDKAEFSVDNVDLCNKCASEIMLILSKNLKGIEQVDKALEAFMKEASEVVKGANP